MKKIITATLVMLSLAACKDRDSDPNKLPDATQEGKNTGGALVNGEVWVAKRDHIGRSTGGLINQYEHNGDYHISVYLPSQNSGLSYILINVRSNEPISEKTYKINRYSDYTSGAMFTNSDSSYYTDEDNSGQITFTKIDEQKTIFSGTFSFKGKNSKGKIVNITEGRFDKRYTH